MAIVDGYRLRLAATHLELVEAFAIDTNDGTLRDEGMRVNLVDDTEDEVALPALGQHKEHLHFLTGIKTVGIKHSTAAMGLTIDALAYLLIAVGNDEELDGLALGVDHLVDTESRNIEHHIAVDHLLPIAQHQVARGDDEDIAYHNDTPKRDVAILIDDGSNDIGAASRPVARQAQSHATTTEHGSNDGGHERLVGQQMRVIVLVDRSDTDRQDENGKYRFQAEPEPKDAQGNGQQHQVDKEIGYLDRETCTPIQDRRNTGYTARCNIIGQEEDTPTNGIAHHADGYRHVITKFGKYTRF